MALTAANHAEIAELAARYGQPRYVAAHLEDGSFAPLTSRDRFGEVCMVFRRPGGLLTARKEYYPPNVVRLPTGGVGHGEAIGEALDREIAEETGLVVVDKRFLAQIDYFTPQSGTEQPAFTTFVFLLDAPEGEPVSHDPAERLESFGLCSPAELGQIAARLRQLEGADPAEIRGTWRAWGEFRAISHEITGEILTADE